MDRVPTVGVVLLDVPRYHRDEGAFTPQGSGLGDRPVGFLSNPATWQCNTLYQVARGCPPEATADGNYQSREAIRNAAKKLDGRVDIITTDCSYTWFMREVFTGLSTPVVSSGFAFLELASNMADQVSIVVSDSSTVSHLMGTVPEGVRLVDLRRTPEWRRLATGDEDASRPLSQTRLAEELDELLRADVEENGSPGACILECTVLPQFRALVREAYDAPVFDVVSSIQSMFDIPTPAHYEFPT